MAKIVWESGDQRIVCGSSLGAVVYERAKKDAMGDVQWQRDSLSSASSEALRFISKTLERAQADTKKSIAEKLFVDAAKAYMISSTHEHLRAMCERWGAYRAAEDDEIPF